MNVLIAYAWLADLRQRELVEEAERHRVAARALRARRASRSVRSARRRGSRRMLGRAA